VIVVEVFVRQVLLIIIEVILILVVVMGTVLVMGTIFVLDIFYDGV
jgi:hypothetical protein